jgi:hypothetical protein
MLQRQCTASALTVLAFGILCSCTCYQLTRSTRNDTLVADMGGARRRSAQGPLRVQRPGREPHV